MGRPIKANKVTKVRVSPLEMCDSCERAPAEFEWVIEYVREGVPECLVRKLCGDCTAKRMVKHRQRARRPARGAAK